jgi:hypothetical protein
VAQQQPPPTPAPAPAKPQKTPRHKKSSTAKTGTDKPADTAPAAPAGSEPPVQQAGNGSPEATSPIGQLASDDPATTANNLREASNLINSTETGLNTVLKKQLGTDQQNTASQIRVFLDKAKQALATNDLDGAKTLAMKAKVLLEELTKE